MKAKKEKSGKAPAPITNDERFSSMHTAPVSAGFSF